MGGGEGGVRVNGAKKEVKRGRRAWGRGMREGKGGGGRKEGEKEGGKKPVAATISINRGREIGSNWRAFYKRGNKKKLIFVYECVCRFVLIYLHKCICASQNKIQTNNNNGIPFATNPLSLTPSPKS